MTKHSRNNTASPVFTYAERKALGQGTKRQRLGRESVKDFDSCSLCLARVRDPRSCSKGHIFCNECVVKSLLTQKKDISRQQALLEKIKVQEEQERQNVRKEARERVLNEFESAQHGGASSTKSNNNNNNSSSSASTPSITSTDKQKSSLNSQELSRLTRENEEAAVEKILFEQAEKRRARLPNFWLPTLTPDAGPEKIKDVQLKTLCFAGKPPHPLTFKSLFEVKFTQLTPEDTDRKHENYLCGACRKALSNSVKMSALKPCGHVICDSCVDTLAKPSLQCPCCDKKLASETSIVQLQREGTGFASGGVAEASRFDVAFQG